MLKNRCFVWSCDPRTVRIIAKSRAVLEALAKGQAISFTERAHYGRIVFHIEATTELDARMASDVLRVATMRP